MSSKPWTCIGPDCNEPLGYLEGNELLVCSEVSARTSTSNLILTCPKCGTTKVWYSSDPLVRAAYNLIDAVASQMARRFMSSIGPATHKLD